MPTRFRVAKGFRKSVFLTLLLFCTLKTFPAFFVVSCALLFCEQNSARDAWWLVYWTVTSGHVWFKIPLIKQQNISSEKIAQTLSQWRQTYGRAEEYRETLIQSIATLVWSEKSFISLNLVAENVSCHRLQNFTLVKYKAL